LYDRNWEILGRTFKFSLAYLVLKIDIIIAIMNLNSISEEFDLMITLIFPSEIVEGHVPHPSEEYYSKGKMPLTLIVLIPLILVFVLASAIVCIYFWRRKMAKRQGKAFAKCIRI
jgi:hypothetical protein